MMQCKDSDKYRLKEQAAMPLTVSMLGRGNVKNNALDQAGGNVCNRKATNNLNDSKDDIDDANSSTQNHNNQQQ